MRPFLLAWGAPRPSPQKKNPTFPERRGWPYVRKSRRVFQLPTSDFQLPTSDFRLPKKLLVFRRTQAMPS